MTELCWVAAIGAGREQVPAIERCRAQGLAVVALDGDPEAPGLQTADASEVVDLTDTEAVLGVLGRHPIEWCVPAPVGRVLATIGAVNDRLGLPGITGAAAEACVDKIRFDHLVRSHGVRCPRRLAIRREAQVIEALRSIGPPCVLKPARGSGSRGVTVCLDHDDLDRAALAAAAHDGPWLVEEFLPGPEVGVDAVVVGGRVRPVLIRDKVLTPLPDRQELGYDVPTGHAVPPIVDELQRCVDSLGLDRCVINADVIITPQGPVVVELAGRPAGLLVAAHVVGAATDVDLLGLAIDVQQGRTIPDPPASIRRPVSLRFLGGEPGTVATIPNIVELRSTADVLHAEVWARPGDTLGTTRTAADVLARGVVITTGATPGAAAAHADELVTAHPITARAHHPLGVS